jgi:hypothetical protein
MVGDVQFEHLSRITEWGGGVGKHTPYCMGSTPHCEKALELGKKTRRDDFERICITDFRDWTFSSATCTLNHFSERVLQ